jgi:hypothetical protein
MGIPFDSIRSENALDFHTGLKGDVGLTGLKWDVGFIYYAYPDSAGSLNYDFWEFQSAVTYDFGIAKLFGSLNYSFDFLVIAAKPFIQKWASIYRSPL